MRSYYWLSVEVIECYNSGLIIKLKVVSPGFKTTVDGAIITCEFVFPSSSQTKHCWIFFMIIVLSSFFPLHVLFLTTLPFSFKTSVLLKLLTGLPCWYKLVFRVLPSNSLRGFQRLVLDHIPSLPPMEKGARLFLGSIPSVSTANWFPAHQEQNNLG